MEINEENEYIPFGELTKTYPVMQFFAMQKEREKKKKNLDRFSFEKEKFIRFEGRTRGSGKLRKRSACCWSASSQGILAY